MRYVRERDYPVPRVISVSGPDLVLERIEGPEMQDVLLADLGRIEAQAEALASLHHRLHEIVAPAWLPERGAGDRVLHLDLHPRNVILSPTGAVVIDWSNASRGPAALDPALAIAIFVTAKANADSMLRGAIDRFIAAFAGHFDAAELERWMPLAIEMRIADTNVTDAERRELTKLVRK